MKPDEAFRLLVRKMRLAQKRLLRTKSNEDVRVARDYERRVDDDLNEFFASEGPTLFEESA